MSDSAFASRPSAPSRNRQGGQVLMWLTLAGLVLGVVGGEVLFHWTNFPAREAWIGNLDFVGRTVFLGPLKTLVVPLMACSILGGIASLGQTARLRRAVIAALTIFWILMLVSAAWAALVVAIACPGGSPQRASIGAAIVPDAARVPIDPATGPGLWGAGRQLLTELLAANPIAAAAEGRLLPIVSVSIALGLALSAAGERGKPVNDVAAALLAGLLRLVQWILWLTPLGVATLIASTVGTIGAAGLTGPLGRYLLSIVIVLLALGLVILPLFLFLLTRRNPYRVLWSVRSALLTAFSSASSSAAVPVTLACLPGAGIAPDVGEFVIPIGTAGNLLGTAAFQAAAVLFLYQLHAIPLHVAEAAVLIVTSWLATLGCAGIPSAAMVTMVIVVESVNGAIAPGQRTLPIASIAVVLGVDRLVDMLRTTVNVWGHVVVAAAVTGWTDRFDARQARTAIATNAISTPGGQS